MLEVAGHSRTEPFCTTQFGGGYEKGPRATMGSRCSLTMLLVKGFRACWILLLFSQVGVTMLCGYTASEQGYIRLHSKRYPITPTPYRRRRTTDIEGAYAPLAPEVWENGAQSLLSFRRPCFSR